MTNSSKYIGMDVHKESISIAVRNSAGKIVMVDRPILGRAIDYVKTDHQVNGASQELAGQPSVQPANPSAFQTLTLRISVRTDWTG